MNLEFQFYRCRIENFKSSRCYFEILLAHLNFWPLVDRLNTVTFTRCLESELMLWFIIHVLCMQRKIQKFSQMSLSLKFINIHFKLLLLYYYYNYWNCHDVPTPQKPWVSCCAPTHKNVGQCCVRIHEENMDSWSINVFWIILSAYASTVMYYTYNTYFSLSVVNFVKEGL